jgi:chromosome segregation ATPase
MKRGFEENVPKVRPRVRLGHALDEQVEEARQVAATEMAEAGIVPDPTPQLPLVPMAAVTEPLAPHRTVEPPARSVEGARRSDPATSTRTARRASTSAIAEVTGLAHALTADLTKAGEVNSRLKADLDAALAALRAAADESREQRAASDRLVTEVQARGGEIRALRADLELLEAERDGVLSHVARLTRELREEKAHSAASLEEAQRSRAETAQAREALQRLAAELRDRLLERDQTRKELLAARAERDRVAEELLAAHADAEAAAQSRSALEEIHQALAEARARMSGIR